MPSKTTKKTTKKTPKKSLVTVDELIYTPYDQYIFLNEDGELVGSDDTIRASLAEMKGKKFARYKFDGIGTIEVVFNKV
jgi:hypothetical protein